MQRWYVKFRAWNERRLTKYWLWGPLALATAGPIMIPGDKWTDMYDVARTAPRFVREGVADTIDLRRNRIGLKTDQEMRYISCEAARSRSSDSDCLPRDRFPLKIKVTLVDYHGKWLIIKADDYNNNQILS